MWKCKRTRTMKTLKINCTIHLFIVYKGYGHTTACVWIYMASFHISCFYTLSHLTGPVWFWDRVSCHSSWPWILKSFTLHPPSPGIIGVSTTTPSLNETFWKYNKRNLLIRFWDAAQAEHSQLWHGLGILNNRVEQRPESESQTQQRSWGTLRKSKKAF